MSSSAAAAALSTFGEGADRETYLADLATGAIYRIVGAD
jgi:hypothetical protein